MSNVYYVHEWNGERFDGTHFYLAQVEHAEGTKKALKASLKPYDVEKELYTEHHTFRFFNTKRECEEFVQTARMSNLWGSETWRSYDTKDGNIGISYDYDKKEKHVRLDYRSRFGWKAEEYITLEFTFDGKLISGEDEYYYTQYLKALETVQKYEKLIHRFTNPNDEGFYNYDNERAVIRDSDFKASKAITNNNNEGRF